MYMGGVDMLIIILSLIFFFIDSLSKHLIINKIPLGISNEVINNFFYITHINNKGAAFSILNGKTIFLIVISIIVIIILLNYIRKNNIKDKLSIISISLVIGGSLGNLFDRITKGYVVDFLDFHIFGYNFPVFNIADTFVTVGVFLLFISLNRKEKESGSR